MSKPDRTPSVVPYGADETIYLVVDNSCPPWSAYRETETERVDLETVVADLLSGQFRGPVRVVAFNTLEHWSEDMSAEIARELQTRCDIEGEGLPDHLQDFVKCYARHQRQLTPRPA